MLERKEREVLIQHRHGTNCLVGLIERGAPLVRPARVGEDQSRTQVPH